MRIVLLVVGLVALPGLAYGAVGDVNQPDVCYMCHDVVEQEQQAPHVHTAFSDGNCSNCHNPHASKHAALLAEDERAMCISCHQDVAQKSGGMVPHSPVERGECSACHAAHASDHRGQLNLALVEQCASCHAAVTGWFERAVVHAPAAGSDCETCHDPHGSDFEGLLPSNVTETCLSCHEPDAAMTAAHGSPAIADSDCTACHDPHASDQKGLLRANEHGPFATGSCSTCHGDMDGRAEFSVAGIRESCEGCHMATKQFADFPYRHNLEHPDSCVQCHNPHASNTEALLLKNTADLCSGCHFNEATREKPQSEYMTHDSMDCSECHVPHGSTNANYLRTDGTALCADCHEAAHRISHPVGPEIVDPRTEQSVTCLSCHQLHGADFGEYIPLDPTRDLCLQCHRR
jgi:predicted CXXCH cytochrome family protein